MFPCNPDIGAVKGLVTRFSAMIRSCGAPCFHNSRHLAGAKASGYGQLFFFNSFFLNTEYLTCTPKYSSVQNSTVKTSETSFGIYKGLELSCQ